MKINFGIGRACINPELPISLAGYFNKRMWDKVLDDLEVRAIIFKSSGKEFAIIHFDLLCIPITLYDEVFAAFKNVNLDRFTPENTLICAIHTHTAPDVNNDPNSPLYRKFAAAKAADALQQAAGNIEEGELFTAMAHDCRFQFNRRYWMKNGTVLTNPGKLNPEIDRPEGDIDPEIPLLAIKNQQGLKVLFSSIVNHTDTIGGCGISSDWCGVMRRELENKMAPGAMVFPLIGASGNINHFDVSSDFDQTCYDEPFRIGRGYAESICKVWNDLKAVEGDNFSFTSAVLNTVPREIDKADIAEAEAIIAKYPEIDLNSCGDLTSEDLAKKSPVVLKFFAEKLIAQAGNQNNPQFRLSGVMFGNAVIASLPSEPFVEIGLALRKSVFHGKHCLVTSHGNYNGGNSYFGGYIPNIWNYGRGGYETTPRSNGFSIHTADQLLQTWHSLTFFPSERK